MANDAKKNLANASTFQRNALLQLPVIDVSPFVTDSSSGARKKAGEQVRQACIDIGFFYITGHGFSRDEMAMTLQLAHQFFALPLDKKMQSAVTSESGNMGFLRIGGMNPTADAAKTADLKERLFLPHDEAADTSSSIWPSEGVLPGFTPFFRKQIAKRVNLARAIARMFALSLKLPETYFDAFYKPMGAANALNFYPSRDPASVQWGFAPHTDYGTFTILLQDDLGGLQARNSDGDWIDVPPISETFVVNVGDLLERWTNNLYVSTLHRAVNTSPKSRLSNAFFVYPDPQSTITCLETCCGQTNPAMYEPVRSGDYVQSLFNQVLKSGAAGLSQRTAERVAQDGA